MFKRFLSEEVIKKIQIQGGFALKQFIDLRVGAFISSHCHEILEMIKQRHFDNGALTRNIFSHIPHHKKIIIEKHDMMLENLDELYFYTLPISEAKSVLELSKNVESRDSFAHYHFSISQIDKIFRICPDASDRLDGLIKISQIYLALAFNSKNIHETLFKEKIETELSTAAQIIR